MIKILIKFLIIFYFLFSTSYAEIVKKFEISGNQRISDETIIIFSEIKINEEIDKSKLNNIIKNLYKTNFFKNISLKFENQILN